MLKFADHGQERDLICTEEEREIFDIVRSLCDDVNLDSDLLELARKSENYVSIVMRSKNNDLIDVARLKFTNRAKWLKIHPRFEKLPIEDPEDVARLYADDVREAVRFNLRYL